MKLKATFLTATALSLAMATTAFAGTWKTGESTNQNRWWYDNGDGSFYHDGWQWIDGNGDGTAECYYFDADGWMLTNTTTPDGYQVNSSGAWVERGAVQTKAIVSSNANANGTVLPSIGQYRLYKTDIIDDATQTYILNSSVFDGSGESYLKILSERLSGGFGDEIPDMIDVEQAEDNFIMLFDEYNGLRIKYTREGNNWYQDGFMYYKVPSIGDDVLTFEAPANGDYSLVYIPHNNKEDLKDQYYTIQDSNTILRHYTKERYDENWEHPLGTYMTEIAIYKKIQ